MSKEQEKLFLQCVEKTNEAAIMRLLSEGVNINCKNKDGDTGLHIALYSKNYKLVDLFLRQSSVDINAKNANGNTPLHVVCTNNDVTLANTLLSSNLSLAVIPKDKGLINALH